ncbi:hypothetical protein [Streptomyces gardneri]|uniref:hypothetical protein n=1 Tax=Streptomyces gardneri TaxID=66892 RepID=UPI0036ABDD44
MTAPNAAGGISSATTPAAVAPAAALTAASPVASARAGSARTTLTDAGMSTLRNRARAGQSMPNRTVPPLRTAWRNASSLSEAGLPVAMVIDSLRFSVRPSARACHQRH